MTELNSHKEHFLKKRKEAFIKFNSLREDFLKRQKGMRADLEEAARIWKEKNQTLEKKKQKFKKRGERK